MEGLNKVFTSELQTYVSELKEVMFQKGYSDCQVQTYNKTWQSILSYASVQPNQEFTEGFRQQFLQDVCAEALEKRDSMYRITRAVNMLSDFTQFHVIFRQYCTPSTDFSEELHDLFSEFLKAEEHRHFSESTMKQLRGRLMRFHDYLYDIGIRDFKSVTGSIINTYILSLARYSTTYVSESLREIRRLLTFGYENGFIDTPLSDFIPHVKNIRQQKIPSTFTDTEIEKILNSVDHSNSIGKRNYAIFLIAARLGIRSSDIRTLTFSNINWDDKLISFCQQKTGHALSLPLPDDVGWAIIDYLKMGVQKLMLKTFLCLICILMENYILLVMLFHDRCEQQVSILPLINVLECTRFDTVWLPECLKMMFLSLLYHKHLDMQISQAQKFT